MQDRNSFIDVIENDKKAFIREKKKVILAHSSLKI